MDDIVVFSATVEEGLAKIKRVLETAGNYDLKIKWNKCVFLKTRIDFLGHTIENGQVWPGKEKIKAVERFPIPTHIKGVQSFLGLTGYFRRFIENYAQIARPLTHLLKKGVPFRMQESEQRAITTLKAALIQYPVLRLYNRSAVTDVHTDASSEGRRSPALNGK